MTTCYLSYRISLIFAGRTYAVRGAIWHHFIIGQLFRQTGPNANMAVVSSKGKQGREEGVIKVIVGKIRVHMY